MMSREKSDSVGAELDFGAIKRCFGIQIPGSSDFLFFSDLRNRIAQNMFNEFPYIKMRIDMEKLARCLEGCVGVAMESIKSQGNLDALQNFNFSGAIQSFYVPEDWFRETYGKYSPRYPLELNRPIRPEVLTQLDRNFNRAVLALLALCLEGIVGCEGLVGIIYMRIGELVGQSLIT